MEEKRLPTNAKEGVLYGSVIAIITASIMVVINVGGSFNEFNLDVLKAILITIPIFFMLAMLLESFFVGKVSKKLVGYFTETSDGFNARILFNILFCVTGMSFLMTIIGGMYGELISGKISLQPILDVPSHWPRNFFIAFWCEILLAQPTARFVMKKIHSKDN